MMIHPSLLWASGSRTIRCLAVVLVSVAAGWAGTGLPPGGRVVRYYGLEQGLGNLGVRCLAQDGSGFLWVGTEDGLYRFSGKEFHGYGQRAGLPSATIEMLVTTRDGLLWAGTPKGLACWNGLSFVAIRPEDGLNPGAIRALALGSGGKLLVGTDDGLFERVGPARFRPVDQWPGGAATALWGREDSHEVWVASWNQGVSRVFRWAAGTWGQADGDSSMAQERLDALAVDGQRRVWARTQKSLWVAESTGARFREVGDVLPPGGQPGVLVSDGQGRVWVPTERGLMILENGVPRRLGAAEGLPPRLISTVMLDGEGSLWLGGVGVQRIPGIGIWEVHGVGQGLPSDLVWCVFRNRAGQLFAGTERGLARATDKGWQVVPGTHALQVRTVVEASDGSLFMAGSPVVLRWNPRQGGVERFGPEAGVEASGRIYRLAMGGDGKLWVATDGDGLLCGEMESRRWRFHRVQLPQTTRNERFEDVWVDGYGRVWACGERGLAVLDGGAWKRFTRQDGLRDDHVSYFRGRSDGTFILAYFEPLGICQVRYASGRFEVVGHLDSQVPPDRTVYLIGEDARRNLWLGTGRGLDLLLASGGVDHFNHRDGLAGDDVNSMAFLADPDGSVWIGTSSGLARFNAQAYRGGPPPPRPELLACRLGGRLVAPGSSPGITVPHGENTFEVHYAVPTYAREGMVQYHSRLVGLDPDWIPTDGNPERFPKLSSGSYRFEVRARIGLGPWGPVAAFPFRVLPAWWETWWARILQGLVGLGALVAFVRVRIRTLRRRTRLLEEMVAARTRELERANAALRDQSLTDPLTGLRNRRFLAVAMPDTVAQIRGDQRGSNLSREALMAGNVDIVFIMVDIDHFKHVNDRYGHMAGDCVIQEMAGILRGAIRESDSVIRWGGEEFLIVARNVSRREATILVERVRCAVALHPFRVGKDETVRRTCSQGFAFFPFVPEQADLFEWERVVDLADHCLLAAKRAGRDAWVGLMPTLEGRAAELRDRLPMEIGELLAEGQLEAKASVAREFLNWQTSAG